MIAIQKEALVLALNKMFKGGHFDICTIDTCLKMTNSIADAETYRIMRTVHCVDFKDMSVDFRNWLFEACANMFTENGFVMTEPQKILRIA
jgi:hypothetical protein